LRGDCCRHFPELLLTLISFAGDDERARRAFMRHRGVSPSEYRRRIRDAGLRNVLTVEFDKKG
jgi:AraC-like DNA-binding protein